MHLLYYKLISISEIKFNNLYFLYCQVDEVVVQLFYILKLFGKTAY